MFIPIRRKKFQFYNRYVTTHRRYYDVTPRCLVLGLTFLQAAPILYEIDSGWQLQLWG